MPGHHIASVLLNPRAFLQGAYRLLFKDICDLFLLLPKGLRRAMLGLGGLMFCQAGAELMMIIAMSRLGMAPADPEGLATLFPYRQIFACLPALKAWAGELPARFLLLATLVICFFVLLKNFVTALTTRFTGSLSERVSLSIGREMMRLYLYSDYCWHLSCASGQALQMLMWRTSVANLLVQQLSALTGIITCAVLFVGMVADEPRLSLSIMIIMVGLGGVVYLGLRRRIDKSAQAAAEAGVRENQVVLAATRGIRDVLIYGQQDSFDSSFTAAIREGIGPKIFLLLANSLPSLILETMGFVLIPLTVALLMAWGESLSAIVSAVMLLVLTAWRVLPYLNRGVGQMVSIRSILPMARPVLAFLKELRASNEELPPPPKNGFSFRWKLELKNASFNYPDSKQTALAGIDIVIPRGSLVGFIGQSGAGKSTCCNLISGLCPPSSGEFLVDGRAPDAEELAALKKRIGFVPQAPFLLAGTVAANVAFSEWGKPWDEEKVIRACKLAAVDFFPLDGQGILHPVGDNGAGLSGGQAQRISIARALYAEPEILIFDEATSALDAGNENIIVSSIERLRGSVTCVIIAHRLSTVERCDIIYWFENGTVVKSGPPESILEEYRQSFRKAGVEGAP